MRCAPRARVRGWTGAHRAALLHEFGGIELPADREEVDGEHPLGLKPSIPSAPLRGLEGPPFHVLTTKKGHAWRAPRLLPDKFCLRAGRRSQSLGLGLGLVLGLVYLAIAADLD